MCSDSNILYKLIGTIWKDLPLELRNLLQSKLLNIRNSVALIISVDPFICTSIHVRVLLIKFMLPVKKIWFCMCRQKPL